MASLDCSPRRRRETIAEADVLNAVWRHWIVHSSSRPIPDPRRFVLNAVWRHWIVHLQWVVPPRQIDARAQRRLASLDCSQQVELTHVGVDFVLNAVWRHWIVHTSKRPPSATMELCAQRRLASLDCSQAFHQAYLRGIRVLNAVWRHWIVHTRIVAATGPVGVCSTPFGVIGLFTLENP